MGDPCTVKEVTTNFHKEHRRRVKERFLQSGLTGFAPHEILELLLFYAIPQKDTNVLAHKLIDRFGSVRGVFSASYEELCEVDGVGDHAATLLRFLPPLASYVRMEAEQEHKRVFETTEDLGEFFLSQFAGVSEETVLLLTLDNSFHMLGCQRVGSGTVNSVGVTVRRMVEIALSAQASMVVLAHNHPTGLAIPSQEDLNTTRTVSEAFTAVGIPLVEHILVANRTFRGLIGGFRGEGGADALTLNAFTAPRIGRMPKGGYR